MNMCFLVRIIIAIVFTLIACNTVFAETCDVPPEWFPPEQSTNIIFEGASPVFMPEFILPNFRTWQQPPWDIGATSEDSVFAEFSPDGTLIIRGRGKIMDFKSIEPPWNEMCKKKNKMSKVFIESGVTHIGDRAFMYCKVFTITIPNSVTSIGKGAFYKSGLTSITILNPVPPQFNYGDLRYETCTLYVPKGSVDAYRKADGWKDFKNIEPIE